MTTLSEQFRAEVETFLERALMDATKLGKDALNDPNFVFDLREGRSPSARTIDKVRAFIARHVPPQAVDAPKKDAAA
jgi:sulfate adenylyltransferase subunit 2